MADYVIESTRSLTITPDSSNEACLNIRVLIDDIIEDEEAFSLTMSSFDAALSIPDQSRTIKLLDSSGKELISDRVSLWLARTVLNHHLY